MDDLIKIGAENNISKRKRNQRAGNPFCEQVEKVCQ